MALTLPPPAPSRIQPPATFIANADARVAWESINVTELNAALGVVNLTKWISGTTYAIGDVTWSPTDFQAYRRKTAGAGTTDPSADPANWQRTEVSASSLQAKTYTAFTTGGTGTAFTLTPTPAITAYAAPQEWDVSFSAACGAAPTFQVSGLATPPNLVKQNADGTYSNLSSGAFPSGWQSKVKMVSATQALVRSLPPGSITTSGLTQTTARLLGRTTASAGAVEEITVGAGLTLSAGMLTGINLGTSVSASGTSVDFTGIPSGVKQIAILFAGVSLSGTSAFLFQVGNGSIVSTGYSGGGCRYGGGAVATASFTAGVSPNNSTAAATSSGSIILSNISGNTWVASGNFGASGGVESGCMCGGSIALGGVLDRVRITTVNGTDTFDAGSINVLYK